MQIKCVCQNSSRQRFNFFAGFTLIEVLISLLVVMVVGELILEGRHLLLLHERSLRRLLARDRAQRVISFLDPRVRQCGAGLWLCDTNQDLQLALGRDETNPPSIANWNNQSSAIQIYKKGFGTGGLEILRNDEEDKDVFQNEGLALLYALPTGIFLSSDMPLSMDRGQRKTFEIIMGTDNTGSEPESVREVLEECFAIEDVSMNNLRCWGVLPALGLPVYITSANPNTSYGKKATITLRPARFANLPDNDGVSIKIPRVMELYRLVFQRFFVREETFRFQTFYRNWSAQNVGIPRENGVLATWFEWRRKEKCLDAWVLATGGNAILENPTERPELWPKAAPWDKSFSKQELYVARASWRLDNFKSDF